MLSAAAVGPRSLSGDGDEAAVDAVANQADAALSAERTFLEFFAGGGMARAGLGEGWRCLFANDFDPGKAAYAWGASVVRWEGRA